ncbi:hypothetical protein LXA43DRAFT_757744 [Ganoderma leucocontextum]|nr:hypothetical protein LXA43DRAFT_757744 [Ganoderma leucocontextum]
MLAYSITKLLLLRFLRMLSFECWWMAFSTNASSTWASSSSSSTQDCRHENKLRHPQADSPEAPSNNTNSPWFYKHRRVRLAKRLSKSMLVLV